MQLWVVASLAGQMRIQIRSRPDEVRPFVEFARSSADTEKEALGFLPARVYQQSADEHRLCVAVAIDGTTETYAGHALFGGKFPHARIFQLFVSNPFRRLGVGRRLVREVVHRAQTAHYMSVSVKVASDLGAANSFWGRMQFALVNSKRGGTARQ
jgi:ribosomal protein S18 acetylase RimI-like enzyme